MKRNVLEFVRLAVKSERKDEMIEKLDKACMDFNNRINSISYEIDLANRINSMTDAEKDMLRKMLNA